MKSKVTIIIACYNDPFVVEAVESARNQTYPNKEIIVVDDGSVQTAAEVIQALSDKADKILVQPNQGQSVARNNAIKEASGTYILNLDSDDYFEPTFCEKAISEFAKDDKIKIVTCKARRFNEDGVIDIFTPRGGDLNQFLFSNAALGSAMFKKADWEETGGYEEKLPVLGFEDWEFYIQLLKKGGYAHVIPEILFNYRIRKNSTTDRIRFQKHEKFKYIIQKHSELYIKNFSGLLDELFNRLHGIENEKRKLKESPDFKIGNFLLKPLRALKKKR